MPSRERAPRVPAVCPHDCPSTCALEVERLDAHTIGKVYGRRDHPYTQGVICAKVSRYAERIHHPNRLLTPLKRIGPKGCGRDGFTPIGWDEALDQTAAGLMNAARTHGAEAVWPFYYAGTMGLVQRDGINRLRHCMGYSRQHSTYCVSIANAGWMAGVGARRGVDTREMVDSDLIVVWGGNPVNTQVNVMHWIAQARKQRNARLVVVDPYRTGTADKADLHLMLRPGTDGALACAVMHVAFRDGHTDLDYLARYSDDPDGLRRHLATRDASWAAAITGLSVEQIETFAAWYGRTPNSFIRLGYGFTRSRNGAAGMHAVSCLPTVTGAWQHRGGGALFGHSGLYPVDKTLIEGLDRLDTRVRELDQSRIGSILCGDPAALAGGPPVTALFIQNTNPAQVAPDSNRVLAGLARDDLFTVVHEQFFTETCAYADIILPATQFLEHDDIYVASGHTHLQVGAAVIQPPNDARSNHDVLCALADRLGARHHGFDTDTAGLIDATLHASGLPDMTTLIEQGGLDLAPPFETAHFLDGFGHPDGRFRFRPDWLALGPLGQQLPDWPDHVPLIDTKHPYRLVTAPARQFLNSSFTETNGSRRLEGEPHVLMHPDDVQQLGLTDGNTVTLGNELGEITVRVRSFDGVQVGVIIVESLWPAADFPGGKGINTLISSEPAPPNGGAVYHDTSVWVRRI